jgi:hypothetical protein
MLLPSPAHSISGPSPLDLATIFYSFSLETSLSVASYDSQGHGGGNRPRLHTGLVTKKGVIKDVPKDMKLENLTQQLKSVDKKKHPIPFQVIDAVRLKMRVKETN